MSSVKFKSYPEMVAAANKAHVNGDKIAAAAIYRDLPVVYPQKKDAALTAATGLKLCGHWSEAVNVLQKAVERMPGTPKILSNLSLAYTELGDFARAADCLEQFLERDPSDPAQWHQLGTLRTRAGEFEDAARAFDRALAADPLNVDTITCRADVLCELGRFDDAIADFRRVEAIQPGNAYALFRLGGISLQVGSAREAVGLLQRAADADPRNAHAFAYLSLALSSLGLFNDAASTAQAAIDVGSDHPLGKFALGTALIGLERFDDAAAILRATTEEAINSDILAALAEAETARENYSGAESAYRQILGLEPENKRARFLIAALHGEAVESPPPEFAVATFDRMAARYDHHTVPARAYTVPTAAIALAEDMLPERSSFQSVLDLGCGTGLVLAALRDAFRIESATGIDIAPRMVEIATQKSLYDRLAVGDAVRTTEALGERFELITAIELAPYLGKLSGLMSVVSARLVPGGVFLCSIERADAPTYALERTGRFSHGRAYLEDAARAESLELMGARDIPLHRVGDRQTIATVALFRRN